MQTLIAPIDDCVYRERNLELRLKTLEADNVQLAADNQQLAQERAELVQEQESLQHEVTRLQEAVDKTGGAGRGSMTFGEMSMEYTESALGARSNTGSTRSIPSRMGSTSNLPQVVPVLVAGLQEDTVPPFPEENEPSGDNGGKDLLQRLEADNDRLRGEVQSLLEELDQVVADNKLLVEDNQQLIDRNAELEARSPPHPLEDAAPIVQSNAADTAPEKEPDASRGSAGSSGMDYQQPLADNMKLASDNRQLLEDNNRLFSDNKKIIVDLSKLQQHGELLFRDNCKVCFSCASACSRSLTRVRVHMCLCLRTPTAMARSHTCW